MTGALRLGDLAAVVRSKNAGPFDVTLDVMLPDAVTYERVRDAGVLRAEAIGALYGVDPALVRVVAFEPALAIKVTMPRPVPSGSPGDADVYGTQQHPPLLDLPIPTVGAPRPPV